MPVRRFAVLGILLLGITCPAAPDAGAADVCPLAEGWEYTWTGAGETPGDWSPLIEPGWPARHSQGGEFWQRVTIPDTSIADPAILLPGVFLFFEAYLDGVRIAGNAHIDKPDTLEVTGFSWYLIELPPHGGVLSLRIVSTYYLTGIGGTPLFGSRAGIYRWITSRDFSRLVIASMCVVVSLISVLLHIGYRKQPEFLFLGLFSICVGAYVFHYTFVKDLLLDRPDFWLYLWLGVIFVMPAGLLGYSSIVFADDRTNRYRLLLRVHIAFLAIGLPVGIVFPDTAGNIVLIVLRILYLLYVAVLLIDVGVRAMKGNRNAAWFLAGLALMAGFGIRDVLSALGLVPWYRPILHIGMCCFLASLSVIVARRAIGVHRRVEEYSRERERIIHELHDGIGGLMTNINLIAEMDGRNRRNEDPDRFATIAALAREGLTEIRQFMRSMDEEECTWERLVASFRRHGSDALEPHGISLSLHAEIGPGVDSPSSHRYLNLSRIYAEALTNAIKHAQATRVEVVFTVSVQGLELRITDNGTGFSPSTGAAGRGLKTMKHRIEALGGALEITSDRGVSLLFTVSPENTPHEG